MQRTNHGTSLVFITWQDVSQESIDIAHLSTLAASMRTETILAYISTIDIVMSNSHFNLSNLHGQQQELAQYLFPKKIADHIAALIKRGERDTFIHDEQLLLAAKLAILHGKPGPPDQMESLHILGQFLLGVNDVLQTGEKMSDSPDELELYLILRRQGLHRNEQIRYLLPRYYDLLVTRSNHVPKVGRSLDEAFRLETGIGIEEYLGFSFLYLTPFFGVTNVETLQQKDFLSIIRRYEEQFRDLEMRERCQEFFSRNRATFSKTYEGEDLLLSSNLPFKHHPLFRMENGSALPISFSLLGEKATMGIYWVLYNHFTEYQSPEAEKGNNEFTTYFGTLFQDYASDLLSRIFNEQDDPEQHFYDENSIQLVSKKADEGKPDGIIVTNNCMVILEMTTSSVQAKVMETGDLAGFRQDMKKFRKKIKQLSNAYDNIAKGRVVVPGLNKDKISNVYQILVLLHPFPQCTESWRLLREPPKAGIAEKFDIKPPYPKLYDWYPFGRGILSTQVHQPQILTMEELEMLEPLLRSGKYSFPDLFNSKLRNSVTANMSMKNFLLMFLNVEELENRSMTTLYKTVTDKMREHLINHIEFAESSGS